MMKYMFLLFAVVLVSCSKENMVARKVDGVWRVDKFQVDSITQAKEVVPRAISFFKCKPESESCEGTIVNYDYTEEDFAWIITNSGENISITLPLYTASYHIDTLTRKKMVLSSNISGAEVVVRFTR